MSFFVKLGGATGATLVVVVEAVATSRPTTHSTLPALRFSQWTFTQQTKNGWIEIESSLKVFSVFSQIH